MGFRLVYRPSVAWAAAYFFGLVTWIGLLLTAFHPERRSLAEVIILLVPVGIGIFLVALFLRGPVIWEVDDLYVGRRVGDRSTKTSLHDVERVTASPVQGSRRAHLILVDHGGRTALTLVASEGLSPEDLRAFYEAVAFELIGFPAQVSNSYGWEPRRPDQREREAAGVWMKPTDFLPHIAYSLIVGGLPLLAGVGLGNAWFTTAGVGFILAGLGLAVFTWRHRKDDQGLNRTGRD